MHLNQYKINYSLRAPNLFNQVEEEKKEIEDEVEVPNEDVIDTVIPINQFKDPSAGLLTQSKGKPKGKINTIQNNDAWEINCKPQKKEAIRLEVLQEEKEKKEMIESQQIVL